MSNHLGVLMAVLGLFAVSFATFGLDAALAAAGATLFFGSVLLLIDFPTGKG